MFEHPSEDREAPAFAAELETYEAARIDPKAFRGQKFFSDEEISADVARAEAKQSEIAASLEAASPLDRKLYRDAKIVEHMLMDAIGKRGWLGEHARLIVPSLYDDYFRGIDGVVQFVKDARNPRHLGFAADFTMTDNKIGPAVWDIVNSLKEGHVPSVKYFDSPLTGKLKNLKMPRVVIGASPENLHRLTDTYAESIHGAASAEEATRLLADDPLQYVVLGEIEAQLSAYKIIAGQFGNAIGEAMHGKALDALREVLNERNISPAELKRHSRGDSFAARITSLFAKLNG